MDPATLQIIGTGLTVFSSIFGGGAARRQAQVEQEQRRFQAKLTRIEAAAAANQRLREFDSAQASNIAFAAFMNRDPSDRSMKAFMDRQKEVAYTDAEMARSTGLIKATQQRMLADAAGVRGRNALVGSFLDAGSAITSGLWRYEVYKTGKTEIT